MEQSLPISVLLFSRPLWMRGPGPRSADVMSVAAARRSYVPKAHWECNYGWLPAPIDFR